MMVNILKSPKIKLDEIFNEQDIREISDEILRAIKIRSKEKVNETLRALKKNNSL
tara:strand:- start:1703 stop:1867 length:165 start_codon:yes stop_codon:yes gene_type:complete